MADRAAGHVRAVANDGGLQARDAGRAERESSRLELVLRQPQLAHALIHCYRHRAPRDAA